MPETLSADDFKLILKEALTEFPKQTPGVYRWTISSVAFIIFSVAITTIIEPSLIGYVSCSVVFMILLIFVLFNIEKSGDTTNRQALILSWFSVFTLIACATAILSSLFFGYPLSISLVDQYDSPRFLEHIKQYDLVDSIILRKAPNSWKQRFGGDFRKIYTFEQRGLTSDYLLLFDASRNVTIRIPSHGGIVQWSVNSAFDDCIKAYCWGDVGRATLHN